MNIISKPSLVSLFAGCGGSSLGYKQAGFDIRLAVEWDAGAVEVYRRNFPDTMVYHGDIAKLSIEEALGDLQPGELDVLDGSPPCQGFSSAGKRRMKDSRNRLFEEYLRLLIGLRPKAFVMENVSGMRKGKMKLVFAEITIALKQVGYRVACRELNAWWYGLPQKRQRLIWIGIREDLSGEPSHPIPTHQKPVSVGVALGTGSQTEKAWGVRNRDFDGHDGPADTLGSMRRPRIKRQGDIRYITVDEAKILQGFPAWFEINENEYKYIGNSVCPPMAEAIGRHLLDINISSHPKRPKDSSEPPAIHAGEGGAAPTRTLQNLFPLRDRMARLVE